MNLASSIVARSLGLVLALPVTASAAVSVPAAPVTSGRGERPAAAPDAGGAPSQPGRVAAAALPMGRTGGGGTAAEGIAAAPLPSATMGTRLPWRRSLRGPGATRLLWTGFRVPPGGDTTELWLQTTAKPEVDTRLEPSGVTFRLMGCRGAERRTDSLPLETRYFASVVSRVSFERHGRHLDVQVALRQDAAPVTRQEPGPEGSWFSVISFSRAPTPKAPPAPVPAPAAPTVSASR